MKKRIIDDVDLIFERYEGFSDDDKEARRARNRALLERILKNKESKAEPEAYVDYDREDSKKMSQQDVEDYLDELELKYDEPEDFEDPEDFKERLDKRRRGRDLAAHDSSLFDDDTFESLKDETFDDNDMGIDYDSYDYDYDQDDEETDGLEDFDYIETATHEDDEKLDDLAREDALKDIETDIGIENDIDNNIIDMVKGRTPTNEIRKRLESLSDREFFKQVCVPILKMKL